MFDHTSACCFQAEELIKQEMLVMLKHDLVYHTPDAASISKATLNKVKSELEGTKPERFDEEELKKVLPFRGVYYFSLFPCVTRPLLLRGSQTGVILAELHAKGSVIKLRLMLTWIIAVVTSGHRLHFFLGLCIDWFPAFPHDVM